MVELGSAAQQIGILVKHQNMNQTNQIPETISIDCSPETPWRTKKEIAARYKCDIRTITNFMRRGILPYVKIGRFVRFNVMECDEALEQHHKRIAGN